MSDASSGSDLKRFFGLLLLIAGVLWLVTTGLCTWIYVPIVTAGRELNANDLMKLSIFIVPSVLFGCGLIVAGRYLRREVK